MRNTSGVWEKIEAVENIVGRIRIGLADRRETKVLLQKPQNAAEIVVNVRDVAWFRIGRDHNQRHSETIDIAGSPAGAIIDHLRWRHMVIPSTPVVPSHDDGGIRPIGTVADGIHDVGYPGGSARGDRIPCMIGILARRNHPTYCWQLAIGYVGENRRGLLGVIDDHVVHPIGTDTRCSVRRRGIRSAHVFDGVGCCPYRIRARSDQLALGDLRKDKPFPILYPRDR